MAIAPKNNSSIWITANAGSGKTTFLTRRVVYLLLHKVAPERICCITYTKAAAGEMRARVLHLLRQLLLVDAAECARMVSGLLERPATPEECAFARTLFGRVLDSPTGGLELTTIHGFCQQILKRFPLEAGLAPHFTVLEESAAEKLLTACKHRLLRTYSAGDPWLDAALGLLGTRGSESRFDDYLGDIVNKRGAWDEIWRGQTPDSLRTRLLAAHGLQVDARADRLITDFSACITDAEAAIIRAHLPQLAAHKNKREQLVAEVFTGWLEIDIDGRAVLIDQFTGLFLTEKNERRKELVSKKDFPDGHALRQVMERLADATERYLQASAGLAAAEESFAVAILARALINLYAQAKADTHALDYDDLIAETRQLFANPAMLGWVMTKLDHRIDHLLIDEAQDTSGEQWAIAELVVDELIAANDGVGSGDLPRTLLVVGDEKQSIYSFQGAAPDLFAAKRSIFGGMLAHSNAPLDHESLSNSYRSAEAVLKLVDHVAAQPDIARALSASGDLPPHQLKREAAAGLVRLYPPLVAPENETMPPLTMPLDYAERKSGAQLLADSIAETVAGWIAEKRLLASEGRPITAGDVLVLVHRRKPIVLPLIRALQRRGVPVAGIDRLTLSDHLAVRDLLALMRWVMNEGDDLALAHLLRSPIIGITDEELRALCVGRVGQLWARVEGEWRTQLNSFLERRTLSPYEFLTDILEVGGARRRFAARFGEEVHEVLDELKTQAAAMPRDMPPTLAYFHHWMEGSKRQIKREQEAGAADHVRIMTVHGAKGLEAPIVILADTVSVPDTRNERIFLARNAARQLLPALAVSDLAKIAPLFTTAKRAKANALRDEYQRLLYVALTRARDELHIFGSASKQDVVKAGSWYETVARSVQLLGAIEEEGTLTLRDARSAMPAKPAIAKAEVAALPAWATLPAPAPQVTRISVTPSQLTQEVSVSAYAGSAGQDMRSRGVRIHRVLELLQEVMEHSTIAALVSLLSPDWSAEEQARAVREIAALHAGENWIWQHPSHAEAAICGVVRIGERDVAINGQIDRLIELPDEVVLLDYKTGRQIPRDQHEISETYRVQLKAYQALVEKLYPTKRVRPAILWTAGPTLMWCDKAVATTGWPNEFVIKQSALVA